MSSRASVFAPPAERAAAEAQRKALHKEGVARPRGAPLVQDPRVYADAWRGPKAVAAARQFLCGAAGTVAALKAACNQDTYARRVRDTLLTSYELEPVPYVPTASFNAPTLRWAKVKDADAVRLFIDSTRRVVIKSYPLGDMQGDGPLVDLANDIVVSDALGALVRDYTHVATPHFAYQVDWFPAPAFVKGKDVGTAREADNKPKVVTEVPLERETLAQYSIVERADRDASDLVKKLGTTLPLLRSLLFCGLYSLEASWLLRGHVHYDFHLGNLMVRALANEPDSPLLNRVWAYKRAGQPDFYYLAPADHGNLFLEIIDNGRARCAVANSTGALAVVGNSVYPEYGIDATDPDRSWDVRRLAIDLLVLVDPDALVRRAAEGRTRYGSEQLAPGEAALVAQYKALVLHALGGRELFTRALQAAANRPLPADAQKHEYLVAFWSAIRDRVNGAPKAAQQSEALSTDVAFFDAVAPVFRAAREAESFGGGTFFENVVDPIFKAQAASRRAFAGVSASSCLDQAFFDALRGPHVDAATRAASLVVGIVREADVLSDPVTAAPPARASPETTRAPLCAFCASAARGLDEATRVPYCGDGCMKAAAADVFRGSRK